MLSLFCYCHTVGIVSGAILQLRTEFQLDCHKQEMVVSSMLMGAVLASLTGGKICTIQGGGGSGPEGDCQVFHPDTFVAYIEFNQLSTALAEKKVKYLQRFKKNTKFNKAQ